MNELSDDDLALMLEGWRLTPGPIWRRLGSRLVTLVDEQVIPEGVRLPTERALASRLGVSRSTTTAAYRHAKQAGRVAGRRGAGSWALRPGTDRSTPADRWAAGAAGKGSPAAGRPAAPAGAFGTLGHQIDGMIDLSLAEVRCDRHTRPLLEQFESGRLASLAVGTGYHPQGLPTLREHLAEYLTGAGMRAHPDEVLVTTGAQQAIWLATTVLCPPGSTVLVEQACYPGALEVFRRLGLRAVPIPTDALGPDPQALAALAARTRPAMAYLVPAAGNPTGVVVPGQRLDAIAEALAGSGVPLLEDRTAAPLANPATLPAPLTARLAPGAAVVVGSMSKVAWAGVRTGWVMAPAALQRDLVAARIAVDLAGSLISQAVALHLVPHLPALAAAVRADLEQNQSALRAALAERLPSWTGDEPDAGGWRWLRLPGDARSLARAAAGHGVLVTPGPLFSAQAGLGDRVRIAAVESGEVLVEGVRRLATAWGAVQHDRPEASDGRDLLLI